MQRLLVTGANGLLGSKVVTLASKGYEVLPLHHARPLHPNSTQVDITNREQTLNIFTRLKPDIAIHAAAETNVDKCETQREHAWNVNAEGTRNIAEACSEVNARLVHISTDYVFDGQKSCYAEEDKPSPISYYGFTKLEGERQVAALCKDYVILRVSVLYGWHPWKQNFATWIISQLRQNKEISVVEDHYNSPTLADNLAEIALEASQTDLQGVYNASGSERASRYEFARRIAEIFRLDSSLIKPIKMNQLTAWVAKRPRDSSLDTSRIRKQLRTRPLDITEGLNKMKAEEKT